MRIHLLHLDIAAAVVAVMMGIDDVANGLVGDLLQLSDDVVVIDFELVIDENHAFVGDQRRRIPGYDLVMDDVKVIFDLHQIQFRRLRRTLRIREPHRAGQEEGDAKPRNESFIHPENSFPLPEGEGKPVFMQGQKEGLRPCLSTEQYAPGCMRRHRRLPAAYR